MMTDTSIFDDVIELPDPRAKARFDALVGLDSVKQRLIKEGQLLLDKKALEQWSNRQYKRQIPLIEAFQNRPALFIFSGDVGTGKTEMAKTFGDAIARDSKLSIKVFSLSLNARGKGAVGEMTTLISQAFDEMRAASALGRGRSANILLIDEADSLAQSRELSQMHHEDRAGVNAIIRGVDALFSENLPVLVVLCTNRMNAIDPAVRRRAVHHFVFERPTKELRLVILTHALEGTALTNENLDEVATAMGERDGSKVGYTYSDIRHRYLPALVLEAFPNEPITFDKAILLVRQIEPTPPFVDG